MIPVVYDKNDTQRNSNGLGRLVDCIECTVDNNLEDYSCELHIVYPLDGSHVELLDYSNVIGVQVEPHGNIQLFDIYKITETESMTVEVDAHHVRHRLRYYPTAWVYGKTVPDIIRSLNMVHVGAKQGSHGSYGTLAGTKNFGYHIPFTFWTNITQASMFYQLTYINMVTQGNIQQNDLYAMITDAEEVPSFWDVLFGKDGFITVYGLSVRFDNFDVYISYPDSLSADRSAEISLRYGKNIESFTRTIDYSDFEIYTHAIPFYTRKLGVDDSGDEVYQWYMSDPTVSNSFPEVVEIPNLPIQPSYNRYTVVDLTDTAAAVGFRAIGYKLTEADLIRLTQIYGQRLNAEKISPAFEVNMAALRSSDSYLEYKSTESLSLGDVITVAIDPINSVVQEQVVNVTHNVLMEEYDEVTIGAVQNTVASVLAELFEERKADTSGALQYSNDLTLTTTSTNMTEYNDGTITWYKYFNVEGVGGESGYTVTSEPIRKSGLFVYGNILLRPWLNEPIELQNDNATFATLSAGVERKVAEGLPEPMMNEVRFVCKTPSYLTMRHQVADVTFYDVEYRIDQNGNLYAKPRTSIPLKNGKNTESPSGTYIDSVNNVIALRVELRYLCKATSYDSSWKNYISANTNWKERESS